MLEKGRISRSGNMRRKNNSRFDNIKWAKCGCESQSSYTDVDGYEKCRSGSWVASDSSKVMANIFGMRYWCVFHKNFIKKIKDYTIFNC